jgi:hypothetical protein
VSAAGAPTRSPNTEIKCIVSADDLTEMERFKRSVAENINRADMTPMEEAKAFRRILDEQEGAEAKDVAKEFGKSSQYVMLRLALLDLTEEVQKHVNSGVTGWGEHSIPATAHRRGQWKYRTCRNWQFAWWLRTNRNAPDAPPSNWQPPEDPDAPEQLSFL